MRAAPLPEQDPASLRSLEARTAWSRLPRVAVKARVSATEDPRMRARLGARSRAVLDAHPDVTTDIDEARALGVPVVDLDASARCHLRRHPQYVELDCMLQFAVSSARGRLLSTWRRRVSLSGAVHDARAALTDLAVEHAVRELPDRLLGSLATARLTASR